MNPRIFNRRVSVLVTAALVAAARLSAQTDACGVANRNKPLPDLIVDAARLESSVIVSAGEKFNSNSCAVIEGCVSGPGAHDLLRFATSFANVGKGDLVIGDPNQCANLYHVSPCHGHFHMEEAADYRLWTEEGYQGWVSGRVANETTDFPTNANLLATAAALKRVIGGHKQGFCMIDTTQYSASAPPAVYTLCGGPGATGSQGISSGWADVYPQHLDGQWVEIDKLAEGTYILEVQTNPRHVFAEADYSNNYGAIRIQYNPGKGRQRPQVTVLPWL